MPFIPVHNGAARAKRKCNDATRWFTLAINWNAQIIIDTHLLSSCYDSILNRIIYG